MDLYKDSVIGYFKDKAKDYDQVDDQIYWVLSDKILWQILKKEVLDKIEKPINFVDAGGGTGRWTMNILDNYNGSKGLLIDFSQEMLNEAIKKFNDKGYNERILIEKSDLDIYDATNKENKYDIAFSFHNVLGFVKNPKNVISKMAKMVKKDGYIIALVPNYYHNIFFNMFVGNMKLAEETFTTDKGKFTEDMPSMNMFTPNKLREIYRDLGLNIELVCGFPVCIYPGMQETQLFGQTDSLKNLLSNKETYNKIFDIEMNLYKNEEAAARGNQIMIVGRKK